MAIVVQESIDGIRAVDGGIPHLGALLLQQPAAHLVDRLLIVRRHLLDSLQGSHLRRNLVVVPRIAGTRGVIIASHFLRIDGIFLQTLHIFCGTLRITMLLEDNGREGFLVDGLVLDVLLQQGNQIVVGRLHVTLQLTAVECTEIEPAQGGERGERGLVAFLLLLLHPLHQVYHLLADILEGFVLHLLGVALLAYHYIQTDHHLLDGYRDVRTALHAGIPRERAVAVLQLLQFRDGRLQTVCNTILVEEFRQSLFLFAFTVSGTHPRRLGQYQVLQFLVLLQLTLQRLFCPRLLFPQLEGLLHLRTLCQQALRQQIAIVGCSLVDGTMLPGLTQYGQRLHHQPRRIVRIFNSQLLLCGTFREELRQVDSLHTRLVLGERYGLGDILAVRQYGQIVLLAVAEAFTHGNDLTNQQGRSGESGLSGVNFKRYRTRFAGLHSEGLFLCKDDLFCLCIQQLQLGFTAGRILTDIEDSCRDLCLVAHADETGNIGLNHHVLLGHSLGADAAIQHVNGIGHTHESPCGQTLGQREFHHHTSLFVSRQHGVAEGGLVQVLAHLYVFFLSRRLLFFSAIRSCDRLCHFI